MCDIQTAPIISTKKGVCKTRWHLWRVLKYFRNWYRSLYTKHKQMLWEAALPMERVCHHFHHWWVCSRADSWAVSAWLERSPGTLTQQQAHFPCLNLWLSCIDYNIIFLTTIIIISIGLALALLRRRLCASKCFISSVLGTRVSVKENTILKKVGKLIIEPALFSTLPGLEENFFEESAGPGDRKQFLLSVQHPATIYLGPRFLFKSMKKIFFFPLRKWFWEEHEK